MRVAGQVAAVLALCSAIGPATAQSTSRKVDLALVLAVDISISMDRHERETQRRGYAAAFRDPAVIRAFTSGFHGRIAVTYFEWGGRGDQTVLIGWTLIDTPAAARAVASRLDALPRGRAHYTALGDALYFAADLFGGLPYSPVRRVIDVSGDGVNNEGLRVDIARDLVAEQGIVINGLPLILEPDGRITILDVPNLDLYYEDCVIGGPGAFALPIRRAEDLAAGIRTKLLLEVAGPRATLLHAAVTPPRVACTIGEKRRGVVPQEKPRRSKRHL
jgi:hypothetical protein